MRSLGGCSLASGWGNDALAPQIEVKLVAVRDLVLLHYLEQLARGLIRAVKENVECGNRAVPRGTSGDSVLSGKSVSAVDSVFSAVSVFSENGKQPQRSL